MKGMKMRRLSVYGMTGPSFKGFVYWKQGMQFAQTFAMKIKAKLARGK